jgi:dipeptidyl aminopeptidase/acylaminoacyl peptidase
VRATRAAFVLLVLRFARRSGATLTALLFAAPTFASTDQLPPIEAFARTPHLADVSISPDKRFLAVVTSAADVRSVIVHDRRGELPPNVLWSSNGRKDVDVQWCRWANATRVLCSLSRTIAEQPYDRSPRGGRIVRASRLLAVNFDGGDPVMLVDGDWTSRYLDPVQDRIVSLTHADHAGVLLELVTYPHYIRFWDGYFGPSGSPWTYVYRVDVYTGEMQEVTRMANDAYFIADASGAVRLAAVENDNGSLTYHHRRGNDAQWRPWATFRVNEPEAEYRPIHPIAGANRFLTVRRLGGVLGVWEVDFRTRQVDPVFRSSMYDADHLAVTSGQAPVAIGYHDARPQTHFLDARARAVVEAAGRFHPESHHSIQDATADQLFYLLRADSDIDGGTYRLADFSAGPAPLEQLGTAYPELVGKDLPRMQSLEYAARDGARIPAYLTAPPSPRGLIVMPHDGPAGRTKWRFDYVRAFLVSRGYAVLQMNYRGSTGYGWSWQQAGFREWDGVIHRDITDGARWAVQQRIVDAGRICIGGFGFGGYQALLGAMREPDLYRCAISVGAWTDLTHARRELDAVQRRELPFRNPARLRLRSPLRQVDAIRSAVLLAHAELDAETPVGQSIAMAEELARRCKAHELVVISGADRELRWQSDRVALLTAMERFLAGALTNAAPAGGCRRE